MTDKHSAGDATAKESAERHRAGENERGGDQSSDPPGGVDPDLTPGDGTLQGSTPAGLTVDQLIDRAEKDKETNQTGTS